MMNVKTVESKGSKRDGLLWTIVGILLVGGIAAYYYFRDVTWSLRAAGGLLLVCIMIGIVLQTKVGQRIWKFIKEARTELRKVTWPTRPEVIQTTLIVVVMVIVVSLILWGIDSILMWAVSWLTGQRG